MSQQFLKMQKLAGLITESEYRKALLTEATDKIPGKEGIIILISDYVKKHIMEHNKPGVGSVFKAGVTEDEIVNMVKEVAPKVTGDGGAYELKKSGIGYDLVLSIDKAKALKDAKEGEVEKQEGPNKVKVISITTSQPLSSFTSDRISLIIRKSNPQFLPDDVKTDDEIAKKIEEGKCYSLLTAFPGNPDIPRASEWGGKFAVIIPGGVKESIKEIVSKVFTKYRRSLKENEAKKEKIFDFLYSDEIQQNTGVTSFTTCDEDDWDKVKEYINGRGINGVTGKQIFLNKNEDVTEEEFDKYYDEWLDNIEDQRADESRNQQDYNY